MRVRKRDVHGLATPRVRGAELRWRCRALGPRSRRDLPRSRETEHADQTPAEGPGTVGPHGRMQGRFATWAMRKNHTPIMVLESADTIVTVSRRAF